MNLSSQSESPPDSRWRRHAPWIGLGLALSWTAAIRIPLILNAEVHLDSDLAVDGLTLLEAVRGQWRWHYPGTPYMGIGPVFLSWLQAWIWGANPITLVSGGTAAHALIVVATFALGWRVFGREVAYWSLIPLTFVSTGVLWMSGRITGGHLLIVGWSAGAWLLFHESLHHGGIIRLGLLGLTCGLGIWLDSMFLMTLGGMAVAGLFGWWIGGKAFQRHGPWLTAGLAFLLTFLAGASPRFIGKAVDPYDAYNEQFSGSLDPEQLAEHGRILILDCLPRLIAGHRLPRLESDPDAALLGTGGPVQSGSRGRREAGGVALAVTAIGLGLFSSSLLILAAIAVAGVEPGERVIAVGLVATSLAIVAGFLINRNIFNSDNSRYLVLLLISWAIGLGALSRRVCRIPRWGRLAAAAAGVAFAVLFTIDSAAWYRRLGWVDERLMPVRQRLDHPVLRWLAEHPEVRSLYGDYWDVYRIAFLTSVDVLGVPFPMFPNRFPEWSAGLPGGRPETLLVRPSREGHHFLNVAMGKGAQVVHRGRGFTIVSWPVAKSNPNIPESTGDGAGSRRPVSR